MKYLFDDKVQDLALGFDGENVVSRLRGTISDEKIALVREFGLGAFSAPAQGVAVIPCMGAQISRVQKLELLFQKLSRCLLDRFLNRVAIDIAKFSTQNYELQMCITKYR